MINFGDRLNVLKSLTIRYKVVLLDNCISSPLFNVYCGAIDKCYQGPTFLRIVFILPLTCNIMKKIKCITIGNIVIIPLIDFFKMLLFLSIVINFLNKL